MNLKPLNDYELWQAISVKSNSRAFTELYNRYWRKIYNTANYYLHNSNTSKQILHDVFVVLWERRKYLHIEKFESYIHVATRYHVFNYLRAAKLSPMEYVENYGTLKHPAVKNSAEDNFMSLDFHNQLSNLLTGLPKRCREIFWMSRVGNLTNEEIANRLGISKRTVENQITYALKHLRLNYSELAGSLLALIVIFY